MSEIDEHQGKKKKEVIDIKENLWDRGIQPEILELILSKLTFIVDINNFHAVCKTWWSITVTVPPPRQLPPPLRCVGSSFPLLFQHMDDQKYRVMHPLYKYTWDMEFPPQVGDGPKKIYFSKYGWSLMTRFHSCRPPILFNPITHEVINLPFTPFIPDLSPCMFFTAPPSHPDCFVVAIVRQSSSIYVHKLGEISSCWKEHDLKGEIDNNFELACHPILYQGLCYCLDLYGNLAAFDIQAIDRTWTVYNMIIPVQRNVSALHRTTLVEHNGQLLVGLIRARCHRSCILKKLDLETESHEPVESLGNNALFISDAASFSQMAIVCGTGNKIFVPFFKTNTDSNQFFSLATGKFHSFSDNHSSHRLSDIDIIHLPNSSWL